MRLEKNIEKKKQHALFFLNLSWIQIFKRSLKMNKWLIAFGLLSFSSISQSAILQVENMTITGGETSVSGVISHILPGDISPIIMDTYQGSPACCSPDARLTSLAYYEFGNFGWVGIHTRLTDYVGHQAPPPSAYVDTDTSNIHLDLSSWTWSWNGYNQHLGSENIVGFYDFTTGLYEISWTVVADGGVFNDQTFNWHVTGVATVVPLPAAFWLFLTGCFVLFKTKVKHNKTTLPYN